jgi:uncharacterized membrane protein YagU involved in acid resistance
MNERHRPGLAILLGGGIAATLDMIYAIVMNEYYADLPPQWTMQSVASGLLGNAAFESGAAGAVLGIVAHFAILFVAAGLYYLASRRIPALRTQAGIYGIVYGVLIYLFMNFVVLPVSAFPFDLKFPIDRLVRGFVSHGLLVGLPIAVAIQRLTLPAAPVAGSERAA